MNDTIGEFAPGSELRGDHAKRRAWKIPALGVSVLAALVVGLVTWSADDDALPTPEPQRPAPGSAAALGPGDAKLSEFITSVVEDADAAWARELQRRHKPYASAELVLLANGFAAVCGLPGGVLGRSQCEANKAYIDLSFQRDLEARYAEASEAARAYAIAHEMGHHVQRVLGVDAKVEKLLEGRPVAGYAVQVQLELQADCFAGVWSRLTGQRHSIEPAEIEAALRQASDLGTERRIAMHDGDPGYSESFTYAIPRRRIYWFQLGYARADILDCDTFAP
jgi:hypothetical protein